MNRPALLPGDGPSRALVAVGVAVLVVGLVVGAVVPAAGVSGLGSPAGGGDPKQVNPSEASDGEGLDAVERQLAERLADRARSGAVNLSSGDIDQARERINGTEYESLLRQYTSVANRTDNATQTLAYRRMLEAQSAFIDSLDRYNRVHDRYEALRNVEYTTAELADARTRPDLSGYEAGAERPSPANRTQIYRSAHRLARLAEDVTESGTQLNRRYRRLGALSSRDFTSARASINGSVGNVTARQATVRKQTFVPTELTVTDRSRTASFSDPLSLEGSVTANGTAVVNGTLAVTVGAQSLRTTTGPNGSFAVSYRPTLVSANRTDVRVAYVPKNDSAHAPVSETFGVNFTRETPQVSLTAEPGSLSYDDSLGVRGRVSVDGTGVPDAPYVVLVGGRAFARNETDGDGRYAVSGPLPSSVADGERAVRVLVTVENRTLAEASANATVEVVELATELSTTATGVEGETVRVRGRLTRLNGGGVPNQTVDLAVNGTAVGSVETTANGSFVKTVAVPGAQVSRGLLGGDESVVVAAAYRDAGSNLGPSRAAMTVTVRTGGRPVALAGLVALIVALAGGALAVRRGQRGRGDDEAGEESGRSARRPTATTSTAGDAASLLAAARERLGTDPEAAVRVGYAALRERIERRGAVPSDGRTHWEFYRDCEAADVDEATLATLRAVTERYEEVAYAANAVGADAARATLEEVESLVDEQTGPDSGGSD